MADTKPVKEVTTFLSENIGEFTRRNEAAGQFDAGQSPSAWFQVPIDDPSLGGVRLRYRDGGCDYAFPPGRFLEVAQNVGHVSFLTLTAPLTTLSFEEALTLAGEIRVGVKDAGWIETNWFDDVSPNKVANNPGAKRARVGAWKPCGKQSQEARLSIKDAGQDVVGTSVPLNAQARAAPARPGGEYVLVLEIYASMN